MTSPETLSTILLLEQSRSRKYILKKIKNDPSPESQAILPYFELLDAEPIAIRFGFRGNQCADGIETLIPSVCDKNNPAVEFLNSQGPLKREAALNNALPSIIVEDNKISDSNLENIWQMEGSKDGDSYLDEDDDIVEAVEAYKKGIEKVQSCSKSVGRILKNFIPLGTGFVVEKDGKKHIMTCAHVVPEQRYVFDLDGIHYNLKKIHSNEDNDIAILEVDNPTNLPEALVVQKNVLLPNNPPCATIGYPMKPHQGEPPSFIKKKFPGELGRKRHSIGIFHRTPTNHIGHTTGTLKGSSGSPIIALDEHNIGIVIGMNTNGGTTANGGIDSKGLFDCLSKVGNTASTSRPSSPSSRPPRPSRPSFRPIRPSRPSPRPLVSPVPPPNPDDNSSNNTLLDRIISFFKNIWDLVSHYFNVITEKVSGAVRRFFNRLCSLFQ